MGLLEVCARRRYGLRAMRVRGAGELRSRGKEEDSDGGVDPRRLRARRWFALCVLNKQPVVDRDMGRLRPLGPRLRGITIAVVGFCSMLDHVTLMNVWLRKIRTT